MLGRRGAIILACAAALVMPAAAHADAFDIPPPHRAATVADDAILVAASAAHNATGVPVALVLVGALVLIALALWGLARWWAWEPPWLVRWRHATAEAGWRASAAWAEFIDWLRLGR
jgi:hypothetical protein